MRIGLVCPYSFEIPGGVQNHLLGLAGWLTAAGHQVQIIAPGCPPPGVLAGHGLTLRHYTSAGPAFPVPFNGSIARINFGIGPASRIKKWLSQHDFDVLHLHEPLGPTISLLALAMTDRPVCATFHTARPPLKILRLVNAIFPQAVRRLDATIAVSALAAQVAQAQTGLIPEIIPNGIELASYPCTSAAGPWRGGQHPRVCFIGRYDEPRKGFSTFAAAVELIRRDYPDTDFVVIGPGRDRQLAGVRFLGQLDDIARNNYLTSSDVYLAPQLGRESFGIVLLEALACGAPVVASGLPAFVEVLSDSAGLIGRIFTPGDPQALAQAVIDSLALPLDSQLARGRAQAARYDWAMLGPQILASYAAAFEHRSATTGRANRLPRLFFA